MTSGGKIVDVYTTAEGGELSRMIDYRRFGYRRLRVLRPAHVACVNAKTMASHGRESQMLSLPLIQAAWQRGLLKPHMDSTHPFRSGLSPRGRGSQEDAAIGKVGKPFIKA